ncbi:hypothetical protein PHLCEN_2v1631 [Hermanssonia centrifuga]|uniref:Uncharacterized protein n=1 Tax=Hermanssonia centrifuga TaxID=98765 RepID=A0A2R6RZN8_9APHY|nr:hypothetical protein PHLCEN_2v1631 [Hermanssonia centrifuga]
MVDSDAGRVTRGRNNEDEELDDDELFAQLEAELEDDMTGGTNRERALEEMKREFERNQKLRETGHGRYDEIQLEKTVLETSIFVGFEEFGNQDNFDTSVIEMKLLETGMIPCQALQVDVSSP